MASDRLVRRLPRRIAGASAVEFALIFPIVFAIVYGGICYGYIYFLQQRINFLAQEAVRAAIAVAPGDDAGAYLAAAQTQGNMAIERNFTAAGVAVPSALAVTTNRKRPAGSNRHPSNGLVCRNSRSTRAAVGSMNSV